MAMAILETIMAALMETKANSRAQETVMATATSETTMVGGKLMEQPVSKSV